MGMQKRNGIVLNDNFLAVDYRNSVLAAVSK